LLRNRSLPTVLVSRPRVGTRRLTLQKTQSPGNGNPLNPDPDTWGFAFLPAGKAQAALETKIGSCCKSLLAAPNYDQCPCER